MSEGELKKRIDELTVEYAKLNESNHYVAGKMDVLQTLGKILDEAKTELDIVSINAFVLGAKMAESLDKDIAIEQLRKALHLCLEHEKKWFGGSAKEK